MPTKIFSLTLILWSLSSASVFAQDADPAPATEEQAPAEDQTETTAPVSNMPDYSLPRFSAGADNTEQALRRLLPQEVNISRIDSDLQTFYTLERQANLPQPKAALLLVPDSDTDTLWVRQSIAILDAYPDEGWMTFAIQPPAVQPKPLPQRTLPSITRIDTPAEGGENTENSENSANTDEAAPTEEPPATDTANTDTATADTTDTQTPTEEASAETPPELPPPDFKTLFDARIDQALAELRNYQLTHIVVVTFGKSAPWAAQYLSEHQDLNLHLALIDPLPDTANNAPPLLNDQLAKLGADWILDLYHTPLPGYAQAAPDARNRRRAASRSNLLHYTQIRLPGNFEGWEPNMPWFTSQLRGAILGRILKPMAELIKMDDNIQKSSSTQQQPPGLRSN